MNRNYRIMFVVIVSLILTNCSKKAKNDEEIKTMIIGTWKYAVSTSLFTSDKPLESEDQDRLVIEFHSNGSYREQWYKGLLKQDQCITVDDNSLFCIERRASPGINFEDSVYYYIKDETIFFSNHDTYDKIKLKWIKPDKFVIEETNRTMKKIN